MNLASNLPSPVVIHLKKRKDGSHLSFTVTPHAIARMYERSRLAGKMSEDRALDILSQSKVINHRPSETNVERNANSIYLYHIELDLILVMAKEGSSSNAFYIATAYNAGKCKWFLSIKKKKAKKWQSFEERFSVVIPEGSIQKQSSRSDILTIKNAQPRPRVRTESAVVVRRAPPINVDRVDMGEGLSEESKAIIELPNNALGHTPFWTRVILFFRNAVQKIQIGRNPIKLS